MTPSTDSNLDADIKRLPVDVRVRLYAELAHIEQQKARAEYDKAYARLVGVVAWVAGPITVAICALVLKAVLS